MKEIAGIRLFTAKEVAEELGVTVITLRSYIKKGKLKAQKIKGEWLISEKNFYDFLQGE